jgi:succinate-semialdehyde dehydrogenase/glutarate-semialdehyde dehydrogenase
MATTTARRLRSVNPTTGELLEEFDIMTEAEVDAGVDRASRGFAQWRRVPLVERAAHLNALAAVLRRERERLARTITIEMGKPITEARAEIDKCAFTCEHYAEHAERLLGDEAAPSDAQHSFIAYTPMGVILAVMPWNYPFWQVLRAAIPALLAGNAMVLKHAQNVTRCALEVEAVIRAAGFPDGLMTTLVIDRVAASQLISDPRVVAVTLTGSTEAGAEVARIAGSQIKKTVLELGGSDPFIVLADADVGRAAQTGMRARFQNAGQSCIAAKRFIVVEAVAGEFESQFVDAVRQLRVGDPLVESTTVGPLARADLRDELEAQIAATVAAGGRLLTGGDHPGERGFFVTPTVIGDCPVDSAGFREETFGPLAAVTRVPDESAAIALANASEFGLGANLWTADVERGVMLAREIQSGGVFINGMTHSDPRLPFGGVKRSGYGRELSYYGAREFCNIQTIWVGE